MGIGSMPDIMEEDGNGNGFGFLGAHFNFLGPQRFQGLAHQVHGAQGMVKTGVVSAGIDQMRHTQLPDPAKSLEVRMFHQFENQVVGHGNKTVNRIVDNFLFSHR